MCDKDLNHLTKKLEHDSLLAIEWFDSNYMKLNEEKCHFIAAGHKFKHILANVGQTMIWEQNKVKLLGVNIDSKLSFNDHVASICVKSGRKLTALTRIVSPLTIEKRKILINTFVEITV